MFDEPSKKEQVERTPYFSMVLRERESHKMLTLRGPVNILTSQSATEDISEEDRNTSKWLLVLCWCTCTCSGEILFQGCGIKQQNENSWEQTGEYMQKSSP